MSLYIDVRVNDRVVATAAIANLSDLNDTSDYGVSVTENGYAPLGIPFMNKQWILSNHDRTSSVWSLIAKVASTAALVSEGLRK